MSSQISWSDSSAFGKSATDPRLAARPQGIVLHRTGPFDNWPYTLPHYCPHAFAQARRPPR